MPHARRRVERERGRERERGDRQSVKRLDGPLQAVCAARTEEGRKGERERERERRQTERKETRRPVTRLYRTHMEETRGEERRGEERLRGEERRGEERRGKERKGEDRGDRKSGTAEQPPKPESIRTLLRTQVNANSDLLQNNRERERGAPPLRVRERD